LTISACGFDGQRAYLLLRVLAVAARGQSGRLRWGGARGVGVAALAARELVRRTLASQLLHADTWHLYYNMTSLLWKGTELEAQLGWRGLARLVVFSLLTAPIFALATSVALAWGGWSRTLRATTVGFSGVLFALKVVANGSARRRSVLPFVGVAVPSTWATWFELVLIQLLVPNTSFVGHLGGIFSGLTYLMLERTTGGRSRGQWAPRQRTRRDRADGAAIPNALQSLRCAIHDMQRQFQQLGRSLFQVVRPSHRHARPRFHGSGTTGTRNVPVD
jgi:membrane associated rhomboid family serine protease